MCEIFDPYTYRSARVTCERFPKMKYERENHKIENEGKIEVSNSNHIFQRER